MAQKDVQLWADTPLAETHWLRLVARFLRHVELQESGCWAWVGSRYQNGRPQFRVGKGCALAARVSYSLWVEDPGLLFVLQDCRSPICVCPAHLYASSGVTGGRIEPEVIAVVRILWTDGIPDSMIAGAYSITVNTVKRIVHERRRRRVLLEMPKGKATVRAKPGNSKDIRGLMSNLLRS